MVERLALTAFLSLFVAAPQGVAQDVEIGKELYKKNCRACHGPTAKGLSSYPKLVGQPSE